MTKEIITLVNTMKKTGGLTGLLTFILASIHFILVAAKEREYKFVTLLTARPHRGNVNGVLLNKCSLKNVISPVSSAKIYYIKAG